MSTYIPYDKLNSAGEKIKRIKKQLENLKITINGKKVKKLDNLTPPSYQEAKKACEKKLGKPTYIVTPDIRWEPGDLNYNFVCKETETQENKKDDNGTIYNIPSIQRIGKAMGYPEYLLQYNEDNIEKIRTFIKNGINEYNSLVEFVQKYNKRIDDLKLALDTEYKNIIMIYDAYNSLEKSAKNEFKGNKSHKKYSKTEIAKKYGKLVTSLKKSGYKKEEAKKYAKKYLSQILKNTKAGKVVSSATVLSVYKQYKKNNKISGSIKTKTKSTNTSSGNSKGTQKVASAKAVTPSSKANSGSSKTKTTSKNKKTSKKSKNKSGAITTAGTGVLSAAMYKKIEKATNDKFKLKDKVASSAEARINRINENLPKEISNLEAERDIKIETYKQSQNEKIIEVYDQAQSRIDSIDDDDPTAKEQIAQIKEQTEQKVAAINQETEEAVANIQAEYQSKIENVQKQAETSINNINEEAQKVTDQLMEGATKETRGAATQFTELKPAEGVEVIDQEELTMVREQTNTSIADINQSRADMENAVSTKLEQIGNESVNEGSNVNNNTQTVVGIEETPQAPPVEEERVISASPPSQNSYSSNNETPIIKENVSTTPPSVPEATKPVEVPKAPETSNSIKQNKTITTPKKVTPSKVEPSTPSTSKKSGGTNIAVPIGLGITAAGAAAVAGVRYVKNKKMNEEIDDSYDDENNQLEEYESIPSGSYMSDDYLGPEGTTYTDIPDDNSYTDTEQLEQELSDDNFESDDVLDELSLD